MQRMIQAATALATSSYTDFMYDCAVRKLMVARERTAAANAECERADAEVRAAAAELAAARIAVIRAYIKAY